MKREWRPIPQESAQRVPPRRRPPTAVGTLRPPPEDDPTPIVYESDVLRRIAQGVLSPVFVGVGIALVGGPLAVAALGIGSLGIGGALAFRAIAGHGVLGSLSRRGRGAPAATGASEP